MSYILDALKRAEADRERGRVPGLLTPGSTHADEGQVASPSPVARSWSWSWPVAGLAALAAIGLTLWLNPGKEPEAPPVVAVPPAPPLPAVAEAAPEPVGASADSTPAPVLNHSPILTPAPAQPTGSEKTRPPVRRDAASPAASASAPDKTTDTGSASAATAKGGAKSGVRRFADLSPEQRSQLPQLNVSGSSYSENPAHRLLILNGKVLREGQEVAPGLVLERIGQGEAVLSQHGLRFSIGF